MPKIPAVDGIRSTAECCACKTWYHNLIVKPSKLPIRTATLPAFTAWLPVLSSRVKAAFTCSVQGASRWDESNPQNDPLYKLRRKPWDGFSRIGPWMNWFMALFFQCIYPIGEELTCTMNRPKQAFAQPSLNWMAVDLSETAMKRIGILPALSRPDMDPSQVKHSNASDNPWKCPWPLHPLA